MSTTSSPEASRGFTLIELIAVVLIILALLGTTTVLFMNGRESVKIRSDANQLISFMKSMLDYTKATGVPLVIQFGGKKKRLSYVDPRSQKSFPLKLESKASILAIKLNDRLYMPESLQAQQEDEEPLEEDSTLYLSEGRGFISMSILLGTKDSEDQIKEATLTKLNLISGKGSVFKLKPQEVQSFLEPTESEEEVESP